MPSPCLNIPPSVVAGDTLTFPVSDPDFPASGAICRFTMLSQSNNFVFDATAEGDNYIVLVTGDLTSAFPVGDYMRALVFLKTDGTRETKHQGSIRISANPFQSITPTWAQATLALIQAAIAGIASGTLASGSIAGQTWTKKNLTEAMNFRDRLLISADADSVRQGLPSKYGSKTIVTRFC